MTPDQIEAWARRLSELGLAELSVTEGDSRLTLRRASGPVAAKAPPAAPETCVVSAPYFGHLHLRHPQRQVPEAPSGAAVTEGKIVAYVEVGGQLHPVVADRAGRLARWLVEDGALVGYGAALAEIAP